VGTLEWKSGTEVIERLLRGGAIMQRQKYCGQYRNNPDDQVVEETWEVNDTSNRPHYLNDLTSLNESTE